MLTTLDIPDELLQKAKSRATAKGVELSAYLNAAVEAHVAEPDEIKSFKPWMHVFDAVARDAAFHAEIKRIDAVIDAEFEQLDPEDRR